jgi:2-oxoisovalerate dehydrogenase E1 component
MRFVDAVRNALWQAMENEDRVLIMGQDIAEYGGVFKVTEGFLERFGCKRVRNTPIIESGVIGAAMGLALEGFKPVVEMQYADFITCGFNQVVNNLSTTHYRWGAPLNVTVRLPFGGSIGAGPFHSQSMEAWFCHVPGLKVVVPATPEDAKGLLIRAIHDPNPVLFFEHKYLYRATKGDVQESPYEIEFGKARLAREGEDLTIVTYGIGVSWALEEAATWERKGVSIEVIDLRTLVPWDLQTVLASVAKTSRVLVLHEAPATAGFGAEVAACIAGEAFSLLDAPPARVGAQDFPIPFAAGMEKKLYGARARLPEAISRLIAY